MIVVLGSPAGGAGELAALLARLGLRVTGSPSAELDDALLSEASGVATPPSSTVFVDPDAIAASITRVPDALIARARSAAQDRALAAIDPRLALTLPLWRTVAPDALYVVLHRHPFLVARDLRAEHGIPFATGLATWQLHMLSALHHSRDARRVLVSHDALVADPGAVARRLSELIARSAGARGPALAPSLAPPAIAPTREPTDESQLTQAQLSLHRALAEDRWPALSREAPFAELARDPLVLWQRASAPPQLPALLDSASASLAAELGRARTAEWHESLRARLASERLERVSAEREELRGALDALRTELAREKARSEAIERRLRELVEPASLPAITSASKAGKGARLAAFAALAPEERLRISGEILHAFRKRLYTEWTKTEGVPYCGLDTAPALSVMVGTLHSDENEFERCVDSVRKQGYRRVRHEVFSGLGKKESVATLMTAFQESDAELLIKVDADMVLVAPDFVERIVRVFQANPGLDLLSVAILDFFSGGPIQGINTYRKTAAWSTARQDSLFTDRSQVPEHKRLVVWPTFVRDALHAPDPTPFQAFHFGVHRGIKTLQPGDRTYYVARAEEQFVYLEKTWEHFQLRRDVRLGLACLGFELALTGRYSLEQLDYTNPFLHEEFEREHAHLDVDEVERRVRALRDARVASEDVNRLRARRDALMARHSAEIRTIVALLPHTKVFGGVNRFFELARQFARLGVRFVIAQPESREAVVAPERADYPDVEVRYFREVIDETWDVVLCGDAFGGVMLTMPLFRAGMSAVYLLNGWGRAPLNQEQIALVAPDVIVANSGYAAAQQVGYAPVVVPGGVDLDMFRPPPAPRARGERLRLCAYPGRRKPSKRFEDTLEACEMLHRRGIPIELHAFDQGPLHLDVPFPFVFHGALEKAAVRQLYWDVDVMVCAEEDGGWSNPAAEAMASGTSLVTTDAGTIDFAIHEETALVVPRRDPRAIATAIERLYRDRALADRLRQAGLARIRGLGWPSVARGLLDALSEARLDGEARAHKNAAALERIQALIKT